MTETFAWTSLQEKLLNIGRIIEDFDHISHLRGSTKPIKLLYVACFLREINRNEDKCISRLQIEPAWIIWLDGGAQCQRTGNQNKPESVS